MTLPTTVVKIKGFFDKNVFQEPIYRENKPLFEAQVQRLPAKVSDLSPTDLPECLQLAAWRDRQQLQPGQVPDNYSYQEKIVAQMHELYNPGYIQAVLIQCMKSIKSPEEREITTKRIMRMVPEVTWQSCDAAISSLLWAAVEASALEIVILWADASGTESEQKSILTACQSFSSPLAAALSRKLAKTHKALDKALRSYPFADVCLFLGSLKMDSKESLRRSRIWMDHNEILEENGLIDDKPEERDYLLQVLGQRTILKLLIDKHIEFKVSPDEGFLDRAIDNDEVALLEYLVSQEPFRDLIKQHHVHKVIELGNSEMWEMLVKNVPNLIQHLDDADILHTAVQKCNEPVVKDILKGHPDFAINRNAEQQYPLSHLQEYTGSAQHNQKLKESAKLIRKHLLEALQYQGISIAEIKSIFLASKVSLNNLSLNLSAFDSGKHSLHQFVDQISRGDIETRRKRPTIKFEPVLSQFISPDLSINPNKPRTSGWNVLRGIGFTRQAIELDKIFEWIRDIHGVKRIVSLKVSDSLMQPYSEEEIENMIKEFDVRKLDWKRTDLSIDAIKAAAPNIEHIVLYSSGNWAAIRHWFGASGVLTLKETLRTVEIVIVSDLISHERAQKIADSVKNLYEDLVKKMPAGFGVIDTKIESWNRKHLINRQQGDQLAGELARELTGLEQFLQWYRKMCQPQHSRPGYPAKPAPRKVKVAVIDNGFDYLSLATHIEDGESFVYHAGEETNWFIASDLHGTQMARLITELNSHCQLYLVKVGDTNTDITADRVAKAIDWSIKQGVDVISISLALRGDPKKDVANKIIKKVNEAAEKKIAVFASTADGAREDEDYYPAKCVNAMTIAGCNAEGRPLTKSDKSHANYYVRGTGFQGDGVRYLEGSEEISGSSVATAIAAGIASMLLVCAEIVDYQPTVDNLEFIRRVFDRMLDPPGKEIKLQKFFFDSSKTGQDGLMWMSQNFVERLGVPTSKRRRQDE